MSAEDVFFSTIEDLHPDVLLHALRRLDGQSLAVLSCATTHLRALSGNGSLWRDLCLSKWPSLRILPSLPVPHRSLFADAHPFPTPAPATIIDDADADLPKTLISAVDLFHRGVPILSKVIETDASTKWFHGSPLRIEALERKDPNAPDAAVVSPEELRLSWVVIDVSSGRAVDVSSRRAVAMESHWYTGETVVRFATVMGGGECTATVVVALGKDTGRVTEVSLTVEDMDGVSLGGRESLAVIKGAMEAARGGGEEEAEQRYKEFVCRRRWRKERRIRREGMLDVCCSAVGGAVFLGFLALVAFR